MTISKTIEALSHVIFFLSSGDMFGTKDGKHDKMRNNSPHMYKNDSNTNDLELSNQWNPFYSTFIIVTYLKYLITVM